MPINAAELVKQTHQEARWLVPNLLVAGGLNLLAGEVATGKTFLALDLALGVAERGETWGGLTVPRGRVLYLCLDSSVGVIGSRLKGLCKGYGIEAPETLVFDFGVRNIAEIEEIEGLKAQIRSGGYVLVVIDALARYLPGVNENTVSAMGPTLTRLRQLATETGCTVLLLHHFNKGINTKAMLSHGLRIRGSSDIFAAVDTALAVMIQGSVRVIKQIKNRLGTEAETRTFLLNQDEDGAIRINFEVGFEDQEEGSTIDVLTMSLVMKILKTKAGHYFTREVLVDLIGDFGPLPGTRSLDKVFAALPEQPGVRVEKKGNFKFYGYVAEEDGEAGQEVLREQEEERERQLKRVEGAKAMLRKALEKGLIELKGKGE